MWLNFYFAFEGNKTTGRKTGVAKRLHNCEILSRHWDDVVPPPPPLPLPKTIVHIAIISNFSWVITVVAREIKDIGYAKFWGVNKVHYGLGEKSVVWILRSCWNEKTV